MMVMSPVKMNVIGAVLSILLYKWTNFSMKVYSKSQLLEIIKEMPVLSVPEIIGKLSNLGDSKQAIVKGILDSSRQQYLESKIMKKMKLLFMRIVNKKFKYQDMRQIYETPVMERVASLLTLSGEAGEKIFILDTLNSNFAAAVESVTNQQRDIEYDAAFNILSLLVYVIGIVTRSDLLTSLSSDYYNSIYEERFILPKSTNIVFGTFQKVGSSVIIQGFKYIAKSKHSLVRMLESQLKVSKFLKYFSGLLLLLAIIWYVYTLSIALMADVRKSKRDVLSRLKKLTVDRYSCKHCNANLRNIILQPCNHLAICKDCLQNVDGKCPVCHKSFDNSIQLFVS